jgi:hypothetical protein
MSNKPALLFGLFAALLPGGCAHQPTVAAAPEPQEKTLRSTVLMSTNKAGTQVTTTRGDTVTVDYEYNDRGRGPKTHTVIRVGPDGVPLSLETTRRSSPSSPANSPTSSSSTATRSRTCPTSAGWCGW